MAIPIQFRPANDEDKSFVDETLLYGTMHQYVEETWREDAEAQRDYYARNRFNPQNTRIIQVNGLDIGRLSTTLRTDCIFIDELHILPEYHRQGIGKKAIEQVLIEAQEKHLLVRATILKVNRPSQLLCFAMGFRVFDFKEHRFHIEHIPAAARWAPALTLPWL